MAKIRKKIAGISLAALTLTFCSLINSANEAKAGETDDLVLATLLAIRLLEQVGVYEEDIYSDMIDALDEGESIKPMPIAILT